MATSKLCVATVVILSLHASQCYILLTANLDDVHALAKQIAASPVASQLNKIIRRASSIFNQQFSKGTQQKPHLRSDPTLDEGPHEGAGTDGSDVEVWKPDPKDADLQNSRMSGSEVSELSSETDTKVNRIERRHQVGPDLVELGKNASFYLSSIKKIFENV